MEHIKLYEDWNTPPEYEDDPDPEEIGREIEHAEAQQLFTPVFCYDEEPHQDGRRRDEGGQPDFDVLMDKTPEGSLWAIRVIDESVPDSYKMLWNTPHGEMYVQDIDSVLNLATDLFKAGDFADGFDSWGDEDYEKNLVRISTPLDVDYMLDYLYDYLKPGHGGYYGKSRKTKPLRPEEISRVKRAITALIRYKKKIESNTVGGPTQA